MAEELNCRECSHCGGMLLIGYCCTLTISIKSIPKDIIENRTKPEWCPKQGVEQC